jgi:cyclic pyranopterin phosphate synthase
MAAKKTSELIPLCHPLPLSHVSIDFEFDDKGAILVRARTRTADRTGVEMEALTAVSVALLTVYDMAKAVDRAMEIGHVHLVEKTGGVRGDYRRSETD